jgi:prepilin-type N-terminal cleavage/methylation domain-containing protein
MNRRTAAAGRGFTPGFTLTELLIVIGIIAVLAGFLLTTYSRSREQANRALCANNLRQVAMGMLSYAQDNEGKLPGPADTTADRAEDWFYWRNTSPHNTSKSIILKYVRQPDATKILRCPSDDTDVRSGPQPYRYSYTLNSMFASRRIQTVQSPASKLMMIEESEVTVNDGAWKVPPIIESLSTRHDPKQRKQGNVAYGDAHVDWFPNKDVVYPKYYDPNVQ